MAMCRHQRMSERVDSPRAGFFASAASCARFRARYEAACCFREDASLGAILEVEAAPVLEALVVAFTPGEGPLTLHEAYALTNLLARTAALAGATPSAVVALSEALCAGMRDAQVAVDAGLVRTLTLVTLEGYCAARDERSSASLRKALAAAQVSVRLAPHCFAIHLAGQHEQADLAPILEGFGRELLRADCQALLLDVTRLDAEHDDVGRAVAELAATGSALGACIFVVGASSRLRARFAAWLDLGDRLQHLDQYEDAQARALAVVGFELKPRARWAALRFWQASSR